jgi:hypothetical protein
LKTAVHFLKTIYIAFEFFKGVTSKHRVTFLNVFKETGTGRGANGLDSPYEIT